MSEHIVHIVKVCLSRHRGDQYVEIDGQRIDRVTDVQIDGGVAGPPRVIVTLIPDVVEYEGTVEDIRIRGLFRKAE